MALDLPGDMENIFLDSGFEENIVYTPDGGVATTIEAIVDRGGVERVESRLKFNTSTDERKYAIEIWINVDDVATVKKNADKVTLAPIIGGADRTFLVKGVVSQDRGCWHLGLGN